MTGRFFGALYSPQGDITTGTIGTVIGSMIAGRHLTVGSATSVTDGGATYVASSYMAAAVPEPSTLVLAFLACACLVWRTLQRIGCDQRAGVRKNPAQRMGVLVGRSLRHDNPASTARQRGARERFASSP